MSSPVDYFSEKQKVTLKFFDEGRVHSPLNGDQPIFALLGWEDVRTLEGKLLTLVDASFPDATQRKAVKDLVRQTVWWHWVPHLDHGPGPANTGMPVLD